MKRWWVAVAMVTMVVGARAQAAEQAFKDPENSSILGKIVTCNDCKAATGKDCQDGAEKGWLEGKPCGKCLLESNYGITVRFAYDLVITGKLTNAAGEPVKDRFVKLFMPNGWGVRTRTGDSGQFRMTVGATAERKRKDALVIELGTYVDSVTEGDAQFSLFMLPETYKPCEAGTVIEEPKKAGAKKADTKGAK